MIQMAGLSDAQLQFVSIGGYIHNLVPVTLGNIVGGALFVATFYYWIFKKKLKEADL